MPACALPLGDIEARLEHYEEPVPGDACRPCALRRRCEGIPEVLEGAPGWKARPLKRMPASVLGPHDRIPDMDPGIRVGRYNRLKEHGTLAGFRAARQEWSPDVHIYVSRREYDSLGVELGGLEAVIARLPVAAPFESFEPLALAPLAPVVLANMLRAHGARVMVRDMAVDVRRRMAGELDVVGDGARWVNFLEGHEDPGLRDVLDRLVDILEPGRATLIGLSAESPADVPLAIAMGREIERRSGADVVIGGRVLGDAERLASFWPQARFIMHEGEIPLLLLASALVRGEPLERVPALGWTDEGVFRQTRSVMHDLDILPVLDLEGVPLDGYDEAYVVEGEGPVLPYIFNKGCPHVCAYCGDFTRRVVRLRSPGRIVEDLASAAEMWGVRRFYFINHLLNADWRHLGELVERLEARKLDIVWVDSCKAEGMDAEMLGRLRKVGASMLCWGLDVGSQRMARAMYKGINLERSVDILRAAHKAGIRNQVNLIPGMPHERWEDVEQTVRLVERLRPYVQRFLIARYRYYPHSLLGLHPERFGLRHGKQGGVDEIDGPSWEEIEGRIEKHVSAVREAAWVKTDLQS